jgi:DNA-3-methyladenine glycosylase II
VRSHRRAAEVLAERDPVLRTLLSRAGPPAFPRPSETHFATLVRAITHQQLAGPAARTIHGRLVTALDGEVAPERLLNLSIDQMRAAGLSANKTASLRDLAEKVLAGAVVLDPKGLARESDEEVISRLSSVRGIGRWTAEVFLMFQLRRMDVWPVGDLGVRKGFGLAWGIPTPAPMQLLGLGEPYRPYRSVVAWYCWRAIDLHSPKATAAAPNGPI